jgi:DNA-binding GntR family transcriptional regulator
MKLTAQDATYIKIWNMIRNGELGPGQHLPERKVAEMIGVKRGPVRESLIRLYSKGIVIKNGEDGFFVKEYTSQEVDEYYEFRETIQAGAIRFAVERASDDEIAGIESTHLQIIDLYKNPNFYSRQQLLEKAMCCEEEFHFAILRAARNSYFLKVFAELNDAQICLRGLSRYFTEQEQIDDRITIINSHDRIVTAMKKRDADKAEAAIRLHISTSRKTTTQRLREFEIAKKRKAV